MPENTHEPTSKLLRLEMLFVFHTEEELVDEEDLTPIEKLPKWTVREFDDGFEIKEGIDLLKNALGLSKKISISLEKLHRRRSRC